jgi:hypothetical protein
VAELELQVLNRWILTLKLISGTREILQTYLVEEGILVIAAVSKTVDSPPVNLRSTIRSQLEPNRPRHY